MPREFCIRERFSISWILRDSRGGLCFQYVMLFYVFVLFCFAIYLCLFLFVLRCEFLMSDMTFIKCCPVGMK